MASTVWRGRLAFGLVSIPVRLNRAARRERMRFHHVYRPAETSEPEPDFSEPEGSAEEEEQPASASRLSPMASMPRRDYRPEPPSDSAPVKRVHATPPEPPSRILRGFEYEKGRYVALERDEVKALRPKTSDSLEIVQFVKVEEIDPIYYDASYYAAPDRGGEKPYAMLFQAMRKTNHAAMGQLAMHGREHVCLVRPGSGGMLLHTLFFENEIHASDEYQVPSGGVEPKELELAELLIRTLAAPFDPSRFRDTFEDRVRELVEARAAAGLAPETGAPPARTPAPVIDIMDALKKSLEAARKPAGRAESAKPARTRKRGR